MVILSKACNPDNFESNNSLKLNFMNIRGLRSTFVDRESFLQTPLTFLLYVCEKNLDASNDSGNFFVTGFSSFNPKGF